MPIYAKLNASMPWNDKVAALSDGQFRAYVKAICAAKQRESPDFLKKTLNDMLGDHSRHVGALVRAGLLDLLEGNRIAVHDYAEHQQPFDSTAAERQKRHRQRVKDRTVPQVDKAVDNDSLRSGSRRDVTRDPLRVVRRDVTVHNTTEQSMEQASSSRVRTTAHAREGEPEASDDVPDEDVPITLTREQLRIVRELQRDHGSEAVSQALQKAKRAGNRDLIGRTATILRGWATQRTAADERARIESNRRAIEADQASIEVSRQTTSEATAAERRAALQSFADGLGSPAQQEGRHPT
jgi:hypothetical protein